MGHFPHGALPQSPTNILCEKYCRRWSHGSSRFCSKWQQLQIFSGNVNKADGTFRIVPESQVESSLKLTANYELIGAQRAATSSDVYLSRGNDGNIWNVTQVVGGFTIALASHSNGPTNVKAGNSQQCVISSPKSSAPTHPKSVSRKNPLLPP
eukprot:TRINITY_DN17760_c0_g1_i1.p1 TRINITY_DN17760_c0_g1~~TRINITY_DN17760_c0_g1_i1.p1  ORF type:complete len:153 (-),score=6.08 TRINITY_DN17760_c0_g1_i1:170-628(-)